MSKKTCTVCGGVMTPRKSIRADISFLGCKSWRKCGRHDLTSGEHISAEEWESLTDRMVSGERRMMEEEARRRQEDSVRKTSAIMAAVLHLGTVKRWDIQADPTNDDPHGESYHVELRVPKAALSKIADLIEPALHIAETDGEYIISVVNLWAACQRDYP